MQVLGQSDLSRCPQDMVKAAFPAKSTPCDSIRDTLYGATESVIRQHVVHHLAIQLLDLVLDPCELQFSKSVPSQ